MLSDYTLDTENFQEIMEEAKNMVVSLYPKWTDFNYHDPGITMLELFSWIKEGQQYFLDQIGLEHKKRYLKLLGESIHKRKAAKTFVKIVAKDNLLIAAGTKMKAGNICFETVREQSVFSGTIKYCFQEGEQLEPGEIREYDEEDFLHIEMFGKNPSEGNCFYIGFEEPLPIRKNIGLYVQLNENITQNRNKITNQFIPMLKLSYEFYSKGEWKLADNIIDTTYGMLEDGIVFFRLTAYMDKMAIHGKEAYYIRIRVVETDIDIPPIIEKIHFNMIPVIQKDTLVCEEEISFDERDGRNFIRGKSYMAIEGMNNIYYKKENVYFPISVYEKYIDTEKGEIEILFDKLPDNVEKEILLISYVENPMNNRCIGIGNGFPYQEFDLKSQDAIQEEVEILVHEIGSGGGYSRWKRVEDFGASKPEDKHYIIDTQEGKLIFGDCERGMAPEGEIILISFAETKGEGGNVKKGKIDRFMHINIEDVNIYNPMDACGGKDEESIEECFFRTRKDMKHPKTAVSYKDYERYVMETPGLMIESCKVILAEQMHTMQRVNKENTLFIVVKPRGKQELSQNYKRNILSYLENFRMLGTQIEIIAPRYIPLEICLDIVTKPQFFDAQDRIEEVVLAYFRKISETFGAVIAYSELYGIIDMLDCVYAVNEITMDLRDSKVTRMQDGNILLPPNGIIELKDIQYQWQIK